MGKTVNSYMCTDFCICPGAPSDDWYKEYEKIDDAVYEANDRVFLGYNGVIDLTRFGSADRKPMFWNYNLGTKTTDPFLEGLTSESMFECLENI